MVSMKKIMIVILLIFILLTSVGCDWSGTNYYKIIYKEDNIFYVCADNNSVVYVWCVYQSTIDIKVSNFINQIQTFPVEVIVTRDEDGKWVDIKCINQR